MNTEQTVATPPPKKSWAKKLLLGFLLFLVLLFLVVGLAVHFLLDSAVKRGVERVGPQMTQTDVKVDSVHVGVISGLGSVNKLVVGNPPGFQSPSAITLGKANVTLRPATVFSSKVVIRTIRAEAPEVYFEQNSSGNNLNIIRANLAKATSDGKSGKSSPQAEPESSSKHLLEVDDFLITGGKVHVNIDTLGVKQSMDVALPEIHLQNLGTDEGITPADLAKKVIEAILAEASKQALAVASGFGKSLKLGGSGSNTLDSVSRGLGDLLKSKKK